MGALAARGRCATKDASSESDSQTLQPLLMVLRVANYSSRNGKPRTMARGFFHQVSSANSFSDAKSNVLLFALGWRYDFYRRDGCSSSSAKRLIFRAVRQVACLASRFPRGAGCRACFGTHGRCLHASANAKQQRGH